MLIQLLGAVCALAIGQDTGSMAIYSPNFQSSKPKVVVPWTMIKQLPKASEWKKVFNEVIAQHEKQYPNTAPKGLDEVSPSLLEFPGLSDESLWFVIPLSPHKPKGVDAAPYKQALLDALSDPDPKIRGQACWLVGKVYDLDLLRGVAKLLDDSGPSMVLGFANQPQPNASEAPPKPGVRPTVRVFAQWAMQRSLGLAFVSKEAFDRWDAAQKDPTQKLWYWDNELSHLWSVEIAAFLNLHRPVQAQLKVANKVPLPLSFKKLPVDVGLKILAYHRWSSLVQNELSRDIGGELYRTGMSKKAVGITYPTAIDRRDIVNYLRKNNLKGTLLDNIDARKTTIPVTSTEYNAMASFVKNFAMELFDRSDDARLEEIQKAKTTASDVAEQIAITRAKINPSQSVKILTDCIRLNPRANFAAYQLAENHGSAAGDFFIEYYANRKYYDQQSLANALNSAAQKRVYIAPQFLLDLAKIEPKPVPDYEDALCSLAKTANLAFKREVVSKGLIEVAQYRSKQFPSSDPSVRTRHLVACQKLRAKLVEGLEALVHNKTLLSARN